MQTGDDDFTTLDELVARLEAQIEAEGARARVGELMPTRRLPARAAAATRSAARRAEHLVSTATGFMAAGARRVAMTRTEVASLAAAFAVPCSAERARPVAGSPRSAAKAESAH